MRKMLRFAPAFIVAVLIFGTMFNGNAYAGVDTMTVNFSSSTSQSQSQTVTIPNLRGISGMTVNNNGTVTYSINGENVTVNVSGGYPVSSYTPSTSASTSLDRSDTNFPDSVYVSQGAYSGYISKSGSYSSKVVSGSPAGSKTATGTQSGYNYNYYVYKKSTGWVQTGSDGSDQPTMSYGPDSDGYSGTLTKGNVDLISDNGVPTGTAAEGATYTRTRIYKAYYSGTVTKPDTRVYSYTQSYSGTIYGSTTYYYAYTVTIYYISNREPAMSVGTPQSDSVYSTSFIPGISVTDPDGDILTCKYFIDSESAPRDTKQISNTATAQNISFNILDVETLSGGSHSITFEVSDGKADPVRQTVPFTVDRTPPEIAAVTCITSATAITVSGSIKEGTTDLDPLPFRYTVDGVQYGWTADVSYTTGPFLPNTRHTVVFEARDRLGNTADKQQDVYTRARKPVISLANGTETTADLSITDDNPSGTKYQIKAGSLYADASGVLTTAPHWITPVGRKVVISGMLPNTRYTISIMARNEDGVETEAEQAEHTTLAQSPDIMFPEVKQTYIKLAWSDVPGATGYIVEADGISKGVVAKAEYIHDGLSPETEHNYRLKVINAGGEGNWGGYFSRSTVPHPPETPVNIEAEESQREVTLTWDRAVKATGYEIEINGGTSLASVGDVRSYAHTGLTPDTEYKYRIRAKNAGGVSAWSELVIISTLPDPPPTPADIRIQKTNTSITLAWQPAARAASYRVEVDGQIIDNQAETSYIHEELLPVSRHTYRIRALNRGGVSAWSEEFVIITNPDTPDTPSNILATADKTSIGLIWYEVPYAENYEVELDGSAVAVTSEPAVTIKGLTPGTSHTCRIRALNITGSSGWSKSVTISTFPEEAGGEEDMSLTNVIAVVTNNSVTLSWEDVIHNAAYEVEADGKLSDNGKSTAYSHTGLKAETYHIYRIRVKNSEGTGSWCAVLAVSTMADIPDAPKGLTTTAVNTSIGLRWERVEGALGYDVEADGEIIDAGELESYIQQQLEPGTAHTYRVRAKNISGVTAWSEAVSQSTTNPTYTIECKKNEEFSLSLIVSDVQDFTGLKLIITYDGEDLDVSDLCGFTPKKDTAADGAIPGTKLKARYKAGRMEFTVDDNIAPGTMWSGEVTNIVFKPKITGKIHLNFYAEAE